MKKRFVKIAGVAAVTGLALAGLASCGSDNYVADVSDGGNVINIRVWNDEFISRFRDYYPEIKSEDKKNEEFTLKSGKKVKFTQVANQNNAYQNALDIALKAQSTAAADDKVDIFLYEADYALKYVNSNYSVDVKDLGITDNDTAQMYQYTKDISKANGRLKGLSWQATPGLFAYRADIAREVFGTDDPVTIQTKLSDWDKFNQAAATLKAKGYYMLAGYDDAFRVYSNNISKPLVQNNKIVIDQQLKNWISQTKDFTEKGYNNKAQLWDTTWNAEQTINGHTFGFFYSTWGINFTLAGNAEIKNEAGENLVGQYRVCEGPAAYYWGGTWIAAANGTDNKTEVADIMRKLTCDKAIAKKITLDTLDYTNNQEAMNEIANDPTYGAQFLGGQNHVKLFAEAAKKINMKNISAFDQGISENLQSAMKDYFNGKVTEEKAWENFYTAIKEVYPELTH